jgi:hypothetical protein
MTKEQKIAEFRSYLTNGGPHQLNIDRIMRDLTAEGVPDSVLDDALHRCARAAGVVLDREEVTAQELSEARNQAVRTALDTAFR